MTAANTPDLRALVERLDSTVTAHEKTVAFGNHFYGSKAHLEIMAEAAAALTTLQHRVAEMEGLLSRAMDRMEYGQRWRCGQVGPTPDYAEIIAEIEARSTLKDRGEGR